MDRHLIVLAGLPGTGKTTVSKLLARNLDDYEVISQNEIRRQQGMTEMPETQEDTLRLIDRMTGDYLRQGKGVIFDSVNRYLFRRHQMYGIASCNGKQVLTLECVCSEDEAKKRMAQKPEGDELLSDPREPEVYDRLSLAWESIGLDFRRPGPDHVSYIKYDTEKLKIHRYIINKQMENFINEIERIILEK